MGQRLSELRRMAGWGGVVVILAIVGDRSVSAEGNLRTLVSKRLIQQSIQQSPEPSSPAATSSSPSAAPAPTPAPAPAPKAVATPTKPATTTVSTSTRRASPRRINRPLLSLSAATNLCDDAPPAGVTPSHAFICNEQQVTTSSSGIIDDLAVNSSDGGTIIFISTADGNPDLWTVEYDFATTAFTTRNITADDSATSAHPIVNADGTTVLFESNGNFDALNVGNSDSSPELYRADQQPNGSWNISQLTDYPTPAGLLPLPFPNPTTRVSRAASSADGEMLVYSTSRPVPGSNNSDGNQELYLYTRSDGMYYQLTDTPATNTFGNPIQNLHPVMDDFGTVVAYLSNKDGNWNVYRISIEENPCIDDPTISGNECAPECQDGDLTTPCPLCTDADPTNDQFVPECSTGSCTDDPNTPNDECDPACLDDDATTACWMCTDADPLNDPAECTVGPSGETRPSFLPINIPASVTEGTAVNVTIEAIDPDVGEVLLLSASGLPAGATFACTDTDPNDGLPCDQFYDDIDGDGLDDQVRVTGTYSWNTTGLGGSTANVTFTVNDGAADINGNPLPDVNQSVTTMVDRVVQPNRPPTITPFAVITVKVGKPVVGAAVYASDPDGDPVDLQLQGVPPGATVSPDPSTPSSSRGILWTPTTADAGTYVITATADDNQNPTVTADPAGTIDVVLNRPPVITSGDTSTAEGLCFIMQLNTMDPDDDPLVYDADPASMPEESVFLKNLQMFHWHPHFGLVPDGGAPVPVPVIFKVSDDNGATWVSKTITINVTDTVVDSSMVIGTNTNFTVTVPASAMVPMSVTVRNNGFSTWTAADGYALVPSYMSAGVPTPTPATLAPGEVVEPGALKTFTINVPAPASRGDYWFRARMSRSGVQFGQTSATAIIQVR